MGGTTKSCQKVVERRYFNLLIPLCIDASLPLRGLALIALLGSDSQLEAAIGALDVAMPQVWPIQVLGRMSSQRSRIASNSLSFKSPASIIFAF